MTPTPPHRLPRPLVAGIGFASTIPAIVAQIPSRLPGIAITSVIEARTRYLEYVRAGEALLGTPDDADLGNTGFDDADDDLGADFVDDESTIATPVSDANPAVSADDLPIPNYDELTMASIRGRLSRLDAVDVELLRAYELAHEARIPILKMYTARLAKLAEE